MMGPQILPASILERYSCEYNNITVIKQENQGFLVPETQEFYMQEGNTFTFDSDDRITANAMEEMYNLAHKDVDVLYIDGSAFMKMKS